VLHRVLALDEEAVVLRVVARPFDVLARERPHVVDAVPDRERRDAGEIAVIAPQQQRARLPGAAW